MSFLAFLVYSCGDLMLPPKSVSTDIQAQQSILSLT